MTEPLTAADIPAESMAQLKDELLALKQSGVGREQGQKYAEAWMDGFGRPAGALDSIVHGITGGFSDEAMGALRSVLPGRDRLTETARARGQLAASGQAHPWLTGAEELFGGILGPGKAAAGIGAAVPRAATAVGRLGQTITGGVLGGAGTAGLYGAGNAVGGPGQRVEAAENAAIPGAIVGGVAAPAAQAIQPIGRRIMQAVNTAGARAAAERNLGTAMTEAGTDPAAVAARVGQAQTAGVPMVAAEGIGQTGQDLLDYVVNTPGAGRNVAKPFLESRQLMQPTRLKEAVGRITGVDAGAATRALDARAARAATAGPQYDAMNTVQTPQPVMEALWRQLQHPEWKAAYAEALNSSRLSASVGDLPRPMPPLDDFMTGKTALTARETDLVLQAVQDRVKAGMTPGVLPGSQAQTGGPTGSRALNRTAEHISEMMRQQVPEFAAARQSYSAASSYLDGLEKGQAALAPKVTIDEFRQMFGRAAPEEQRGLREGLVSAYKATLENFRRGPAADVTKDALGKEALREKFRVALGSNQADALLRQLEMEAVTSQTAGGVKNSLTSFRGANKEAIEGEPLVQGGNFSLMGLIGRGLGKLDEATSRRMREQLAGTLLEQRPSEVERLLREAMARNPHLFGGAGVGANVGTGAALLTDRGR